MSEPENQAEPDPTDPKERMRQALDAKQQAQHGQDLGRGPDKSIGHAQGKAAGRRQFRRKSGG